MQAYFPNKWAPRLLHVNSLKGERIRIASDWHSIGSVSASAWYVAGQRLTLSDSNLAVSVADVLMTMLGVGVEMIENVVTFASGEIRSQQFEIEIRPSLTDVPGCPELIDPPDAEVLSSESSVLLSWGPAVGATSYNVYVWTDGVAKPSTPTAVVAGNTYLVTGLTGDTTYRWSIDAVSSAGTSDGCEEHTFATFHVLCPVLVTPNNGADVASEDSATLVWLPSVDAVEYGVFVWADGDPEPVTPTATTSETTYEATGLTPATEYHWKIIAYGASSTSTGCGERTFTTDAPGCPALLAPLPGASVGTTVTLTWAAVASSTEYRVYVWPAADPMPGSPTATTDSVTLEYEATGLTEGVEYEWVVHSVVGAVESSGCAGQTFEVAVSLDGVLVNLTTGWDSLGADGVEWQAQVYDTGDWWTPDPFFSNELVLPAGVALVRVTYGVEAFGSTVPSDVRTFKNGAVVHGGAGAQSGSSDRITAVSGLLAVSTADAFETVLGEEVVATTRSWMAAEKVAASTKYALVRRATNLSLVAGAFTPIPWTAETVDTDAFHDNSINPSRFTVPSGVTLIRFSGCVSLTQANTQMYIDCYKNGAAFLGQFVRSQERNSEIMLGGVTPPLVVTPGDYFEMRVRSGHLARTLLSEEYTWGCIEECDPAFGRVLVNKSASQAFTSGVAEAVVFESTEYDTGAMYDPAQPTRLTVPDGAVYARLSFNLIFPVASGEQAAAVYKNGAQTYGLPFDAGRKATGTQIQRLNSIGSWVEVSGGDYFEVFVTAGATLSLAAGNGVWFCMETRTA